mmetsp:Transcript_30124/g.59618  ORF Transcript_30124/g.59618 Transcript_30124/m.59618 type:complete len:320 (-) Transcript_30124:294-1253(-)
MRVDETGAVALLHVLPRDPVFEDGEGPAVEEEPDLLHGRRHFPDVQGLETAGTQVDGGGAFVVGIFEIALDAHRQPDGVQDGGAGGALGVVLADVHVERPVQNIVDAGGEDVRRFGNLVEEGPHGRGEEDLELVLVADRNFRHLRQVVGLPPHAGFEDGRVHDGLEGLAFERRETAGVAVGEKVEDEGNADVRRRQKLNEAFRIRGGQHVAERGEFGGGQVEDVVLTADVGRVFLGLGVLFGTGVHHGRRIGRGQFGPLRLRLGEELQKFGVGPHPVHLLGVLRHRHKFLRMPAEGRDGQPQKLCWSVFCRMFHRSVAS